MGIRALEPVVAGAQGSWGSGPRERTKGAPPQRGFRGWGGCAALRSDALSREPFVKGDPSGWASPGGSGNLKAASREPGVDWVVPDL